MRPKVTYADVRRYSLSDNKAEKISVLDRLFYRKIADLITVVLINYTNIKPNFISKMSIIFSIIGGLILAESQTFLSYTLSALMFNMFFLLDVVDGSLARTLKYLDDFPISPSDKLGKFYDALAGYMFCSIFWLSLCVNIFLNDKGNSIIFAVIITLVCSLLGRLIKSKFNLSVKEENLEKVFSNIQGEGSLFFKIFKNLEFGGFFGFFLFFLWVPLFLQIFILTYMVFNFLILAKALKDSWIEK